MFVTSPSRLMALTMVGAAMAAGAVAGTVSIAGADQTAAESNLVRACIKNDGGAMRYLKSATKKCRSGEDLATWSKRGPKGARGLIGPTGAKGDTGEAGPIGEAGPTGATGPPGPSGSPGANGNRGPNGETGPSGPAGATGYELVDATGWSGGAPGLLSSTATCPGTKVVVGGDYDAAGMTAADAVLWSYPSTSQTWLVGVQAAGGGMIYRARAICMSVS